MINLGMRISVTDKFHTKKSVMIHSIKTKTFMKKMRFEHFSYAFFIFKNLSYKNFSVDKFFYEKFNYRKIQL